MNITGITPYIVLLLDSLSKNETKISPDSTDGVTLTATTNQWEYGSIVEVEDDAGIKPIVIHGISVIAISAEEQQVQLYKGEASSEVAIPGAKIVFSQKGYYPFPFPIYVSGSDLRISAAMMSDGTVADTCAIYVHYTPIG